MGTQKLFFTLLLCSSIFFLIGIGEVESSHHHHHHHRHRHGTGYRPKKLFVFGDSYADTGNTRKSYGNSWNEPYGITFPGKPSGRFSDGRVFTDFLARFLGSKSPVAYRWRKYTPPSFLKYGMNFAFGGTGAFDTVAPYPNMTTQIDFFQGLLNESVFTPTNLQDSIAHVSLAGNDYSNYLAKGGTAEGLQTFIPQVVNQLVLDLQRINSLGVKRISVTALQPLGCLPRSTIETSFQQCNETFNKAVIFHNLLLQQAISKLNNQTTDHSSPFVIIDLYSAFSSIIQQKGAEQGSSMFDNPLKPCCVGINTTYACGNVDAKGNKLYTICEDRKSSFFWDTVHPTQAGWTAVTLALQSTLEELHY